MSGNIKLAMSHVVPDLVQKVLKGQDPLHILGDGDAGAPLHLRRRPRARHPARDGAPGGAQRGLQHLDRRRRRRCSSWPRRSGTRSTATEPFRYVSDPPFDHDVQTARAGRAKATRVLGFEATTRSTTMLDEVIPWIAGRARGRSDVMAGVGPSRGEIAVRGRKAWTWRLASLGVSLVALVVVASSVDLAAAWTTLTQASAPIVGVAMGVVVIQLVLRGWRWRIVLPDRPDGTPVPVRRTIVPLLVGYLGNAVLPARLGEPIRALLVARRESLDPMTAFGATMLERLIDIVTLAAIGLVAALAIGASWWILRSAHSSRPLVSWGSGSSSWSG